MLQALELGYDVTGVDLSEHALVRAKKRLEDRSYLPSLVHGDVLDRDVLSDRFDCILLHHVMDNLLIEDRCEMVDTSKEILNEGGIISFQDLSTDDVRFGKGTEVEPNTFLKGDGIRLHFFDVDEVRELFGSMTELSLEKYEWVQGRGPSMITKSRIVGTFQLPSF
jgi:ubiquinone/menaquinone biosynthesis C-methylase UbiE